jgi:hypothetical protein
MDFDSAEYWRKRYELGGNSGAGSYGALADFKAEALNRFIESHAISFAVEYGSGDGNQLSLLRITSYIGLDISATAIANIGDRFRDDLSKTFMEYDPDTFLAGESVKADIALSMDVILHLTEDQRYERYMHYLVNSGKEFVGIFNTATEVQLEKMAKHNRFRDHREWLAKLAPEFIEVEVALTPSGLGYPEETGFYFYMRT